MYTYLIGWSRLNLWYYGVRYAKKSSPDDLFRSYYTPSPYVHFIMRKHGIPDVIQVRRTFTDKKKAIQWSQKVLRRMKVLRDKRWLNKNMSGVVITDTEALEKIKSMKAGRVWLHKDGKKILVLKELVKNFEYEGYQRGQGTSRKGSQTPMYGKKHKEETKAAISMKNRVSRLSKEGRAKKAEYMSLNNPMHDDETRAKHLEWAKNNTKSCKKIFHNDKVFNSIKEASQHYPEMKYSTIAWKCKHEKDGWGFQPS